MKDFHALHWLSNLLTLQDISYNKPLQHIKLDIEYSKIDKKR